MISTTSYLDNWSTQIRKGVLDLCIMKCLLEGEKYGYQIVRELELHNPLIIKEGIIYPILAKLKKSGLLTSSLKDKGVGPARRYYALTEEGRNFLGEMNQYWEDLNKSIQKL